MSRLPAYFLSRRYKSWQGNGLRAAGGDVWREVNESEFVEQTPENFSQELFFNHEREALASYRNNFDIFPYYRHYAHELLWRASPYDSPYTERLMQLYPHLSLEHIQILCREPGLLPLPQSPKARWRSVTHYDEGLYELAEAFSGCTTAIVTPRFGIGGGEKVVRVLAEAIRQVSGEKVCIVVADTEQDGMDGVVPLASVGLNGKRFLESPPERRMTALRDFLVCIGAKYMLTANSWIGNSAIQSGCFDDTGIRIAYGIFSMPVMRTGEIAGYVRDLDWVVPKTTALFTDNARMANYLKTEYAADNVHVLNIPEAAAESPTEAGKSVLWASRIDDEKRPDLLLEIAAAMPAVSFQVWGAPLLTGHAYLDSIKDMPNIRYRGPFTSFRDIDLTDIGCFLYTSRYDGKPNTVIEAMARGLVCIASAVGGIPELLEEGRGFLLPATATARDYAEQIDRAMTLKSRRHIAQKAQSYVRFHHTKEIFRAQVAGMLSSIAS